MFRTTFLTFRSGLKTGCQLASPSYHNTLQHSYSPLRMSRRSSRISGQGSSPSPSIPAPTLLAHKSYSTDASSSAGPSSNTNAAPSPYFEEWPTPALQAEVKRYGFKVSRKRSTLIDQLKAVYAALQRSGTPFETPAPVEAPLPIDAVEAEMKDGARSKRQLILPPSAVNGKGKGKGRKSDPFVLDASSASEEEQAGDYTAQLELEAASATSGSPSPSPSSRLPLSASASPSKRRDRSNSPSTSSSEDIPLSSIHRQEEEGVPIDPTPPLAETMTRAIRADAGVWGRILRYEPISFDEVVSIATQNGLEMGTGKRKEELRTWLDRQCICFYSAELTGSRSRH